MDRLISLKFKLFPKREERINLRKKNLFSFSHLSGKLSHKYSESAKEVKLNSFINKRTDDENKVVNSNFEKISKISKDSFGSTSYKLKLLHSTKVTAKEAGENDNVDHSNAVKNTESKPKANVTNCDTANFHDNNTESSSTSKCKGTDNRNDQEFDLKHWSSDVDIHSPTPRTSENSSIPTADDDFLCDKTNMMVNRKSSIQFEKYRQEISSEEDMAVFRHRLLKHFKQDGEDIDDKKLNSLDKRIFMMNEIIIQEKHYVAYLGLLNIFFMRLQIIANGDTDAMQLFECTKDVNDCIQVLYDVHSQVILHKFETIEENWPASECFWTIILKKCDFFLHYITYYRDYEYFTDILKETRENSSVVRNLINDLSTCSVLKNMSFMQNLLRPIQQLMRYRLHITRYLRHASNPPNESDETQKALDALQKIITICNSRVGTSFADVVSLQERLRHQALLIAPSRRIVKHGQLQKINARNGEPAHRYVILCSDCIIICSYQVKAINSKLDIRQLLGLTKNVYINRLNGTSFRIFAVQRVIDLQGSSSDDVDHWVRLLVENGASETLSDPTEIGERAPLWQRDQDTTKCTLCKREFTVVFRRHHCRSCGRIVCLLCSRHSEILNYCPGKLQRVCDTCHEKLNVESSKKCKRNSFSCGQDKIFFKPSKVILQGVFSHSIQGCSMRSSKYMFVFDEDMYMYGFENNKQTTAKLRFTLVNSRITSRKVGKTCLIQIIDDIGLFHCLKTEDEKKYHLWVETFKRYQHNFVNEQTL